MASSTKPRYGVRLTLPGAAGGTYDIPGLHIPLPGDGETVPLETDDDVARARDIAKTAPIEVVDIKPSGKPGGKEA